MTTSLRLLKSFAIAAAAVFLALAAFQPGPRPAEAVFEDTDGDFSPDIIEIVTGSDPNNPNSTSESTEVDFVGGGTCFDERDNDLDGLTDADDDGCSDSDFDIVSDATETFLGSDPNNSASFPEDSRFDTIAAGAGLPIFWCGDRLDKDGDGLVDGDDPGSTPIANAGDDFDDATEKRFGSDPANANSVPEHEIPNPGSCSDGVDNDLDGTTDAADAACSAPTNDDRADAKVIAALPFSQGPFVAKNATGERGEPRPRCYFNLDSTVWYRFTPATDMGLIADNFGSNFSTVVAVWKESGSRLTEVACAYGYPGPDPEDQARVAFRATAGQTYFFQGDGYPCSSFSGLPELAFHLATGTPPANDQFGDATVIGSLPYANTVDTDAATTQQYEPRPY